MRQYQMALDGVSESRPCSFRQLVGDPMIKWLTGRLNCLRAQHMRSESAVRPVGDTYESKCAYCGVPMLRLAKRNWIVKPR